MALTTYNDIPYDIRMNIIHTSIQLCKDDTEIFKLILNIQQIDKELHQNIVDAIDPILENDAYIEDMDDADLLLFERSLPYKIKNISKENIINYRKRDHCGLSIGMKESIRICHQECNDYIKSMTELIETQVRNEIEEYRLYGIFTSIRKETVELLRTELEYKKREWKKKKTCLCRRIHYSKIV